MEVLPAGGCLLGPACGVEVVVGEGGEVPDLGFGPRQDRGAPFWGELVVEDGQGGDAAAADFHGDGGGGVWAVVGLQVEGDYTAAVGQDANGRVEFCPMLTCGA